MAPRLDEGNGYGVTGQHHEPHDTLQPQGHRTEATRDEEM